MRIHDLVAAEDFEYQLLWFAGIYVRPYSKIIFGKSHFKGGKKYCRTNSLVN